MADLPGCCRAAAAAQSLGWSGGACGASLPDSMLSEGAGQAALVRGRRPSQACLACRSVACDWLGLGEGSSDVMLSQLTLPVGAQLELWLAVTPPWPSD